MENQQRQQLKKYIDLLLFHWKLIAACLLVAVTVGLVQYLRMPKVYQATSLLSYERQQINPSRMSPERNNQQLRDMISTLSNVVISRNNLEGIIKQFDLYPGARQRLPIEDVIESMRKHIKVAPSRRGDTFTVSFDGGDQDKVMKVTNALAAKFIEENLKYREERASETSKYTQDELDLAKTVLDKKEEIMRDYKLQYYNEMPEQRDSNLNRLNSLQKQYQGVQDSIQDLERTRVMVQEQINLRQRIASAGSVQDRKGQPLSPRERLQQLYHHLEAINVKYTDKHPEIRRTKKQIAKLEAELGSGKRSAATAGSVTSRGGTNPDVAQLRLQLDNISYNIKKLKDDQVKMRAGIEQYEKWVAAAPVREAEWSALTRDYKELRNHYDNLVSRNLQASSVEHLERKQKGSKFKIVDSASFPDKPYKPNFLRILMIAVGAGLGVGVGLVLVLDFMDTSFRDASEVEGFLGLPVICSIPYLEGDEETSRKRKMSLLWGMGFVLYTGALMLALTYFWLQGRIIL